MGQRHRITSKPFQDWPDGEFKERRLFAGSMGILKHAEANEDSAVEDGTKDKSEVT